MMQGSVNSPTIARGTQSLDDPQRNGCIVIGVLSDTHGQLYPEVLRSLQGVDHIIHAGDVGSPQVLTTLRAVAPVTAVRGNCDLEAWAEALPQRAEVSLGGARILVAHIARRVSWHTDASGRLQAGREVAAVVFGHSHCASVEERDQVLYLNPGSAGPRRFGRPRTVARLEILPPGTCESGAGPQDRPRISATILPVAD
jgi:putative phosphoesterase